ncbi:formate dehydrogenase accessory sulfurtransferase FdhD [Thermodesulforhabdus norvegica]|uniref:Sulfur carrier protein FdhD n=1 Tax=Thermodesulforhabdus norvegica TaxID=39841 RepID=A0A1I4SP36_9BACT|nr:formate dehydrogenase accessory sulfurtransferase FdhD [Thermodesulforhabdus norvegica]SFM66278.1 FdhD protein [Thermodesulforhabdus norvegica]
MEETLLIDQTPEDEPSAEVDVLICKKGDLCLGTRQWIVEETPVTLYFNGDQMITLMCAGKHLDELAVGFFIGEGWIRDRKKLQGVSVDSERGVVDVKYEGDVGSRDKFWLKRAITSGCAKGSVFCDVLDELLSKPVNSEVSVRPDQIWQLMESLNRFSSTYKRTHGVHNCILATTDDVIYYRYDIGRHNALDMIIGRAFMDDMSLSDKLFITTGRLTSEVIIKAAQVGIPIVASRHAATKLAVDLAETLNLTLIGYVRGSSMTVYAGKDRLILEKW